MLDLGVEIAADGIKRLPKRHEHRLQRRDYPASRPAWNSKTTQENKTFEKLQSVKRSKF